MLEGLDQETKENHCKDKSGEQVISFVLFLREYFYILKIAVTDSKSL